MSPNLAQLKAQLRARIAARARQMTEADRAAGSLAICQQLQQLPPWLRISVVLFFAPLPDEPDIWPALKLALLQGKVVGLPRYNAADDSYAAYQVVDPQRDVCLGHYGIREPVVSCPPVAPDRVELVLVPGVGFGLNGGRLGRGKGYYDRLLAKLPGAKCGVAFDWQIEPEIPLAPHDVPMDWLVTPSKCLEAGLSRHR